jgi:hypothetical protein
VVVLALVEEALEEVDLRLLEVELEVELAVELVVEEALEEAAPLLVVAAAALGLYFLHYQPPSRLARCQTSCKSVD